MRNKRFITMGLAFVCSLMMFAGCNGNQEKPKIEEPENPNNQTYQNSPFVREELTFENATDVNGGYLMLTTAGTSKYKIVIPASKTSYDSVAANDLQLFLEEASGCKLPIVTDTEIVYDETDYFISVGTTTLYYTMSTQTNIVADYAELDEDGSLIHLQGNVIYLTGAAGYGTLNAVYRFLEYEVGYEAYALDEIYVEKMVDVPVLKFENTKIKEKSVYRDIQHGKVFAASSASAAARMGLISSASGGLSLDGRIFAQFIHSFKTLVPPSSSKEGWWNNGQLCLTNDEVVTAVAEASKKYMLQYPSARYMMYGGEDDTSACSCENCQAEAKKYGGHGALLLKFCNKISLALDEWLKDNNREHIIFMALNYLAYESAPAYLDRTTGEYTPYDETCIARDNVGTFLCFPSADYGHSLDDPTSSVNVIEYEKVKAWSVCTENMGVYLYLADYTNYFQYYNAISSYQGWLRTLQEFGVDLFFLHNIGENVYSPLGELKLYLLSKLSADATKASQEELTIDFMNHYYKVAATDMYEYYNEMSMHYTLISANNSNNQDVDCYGTMPAYGSTEYYPLGVINKFLKILDNAYQSVEESVLEEEVKAKLRLRISVEEFCIRYYKYKGHLDTMTEQERQVEAAFLNAKAKELGVTCYGENKLWIDL